MVSVRSSSCSLHFPLVRRRKKGGDLRPDTNEQIISRVNGVCISQTRIFTVIRAFLAVGYAILARTRFALYGRHRPSQIFPDTKLALGASRRLGELRSSRIRLEKLLDLVEDP